MTINPNALEYTKQLLLELNFTLDTTKTVRDVMIFMTTIKDNDEENKLHSTVQ